MKQSFWKFLTFLFILTTLLFFYLWLQPETKEPPAKKSFIITNHEFIDGLYSTDLNLSNSTDVFRFVLNNLDDEVVVYPTENFFYFQFPYAGKIIGGSIGLFAEMRDNGTIGFGYAEDKEDPGHVRGIFGVDRSRVGGGGLLSAKDGVFVEKISDFKYKITFENRSVIFNLNDVGYFPPKNAKLTEDEIFVGPVFDDSGLKFSLIYNEQVPKLYLILNADNFVPDSFEPYAGLLRTKRTQFVFYNDSSNNRLILVGVYGFNVLQNNWYDGPFDHMPDNYIKAGLIPDYQKYLEAGYPGTAGRIDMYGHYLNETGVRIAVGPYHVYFTEDDLSFIEWCKSLEISASEFYSCITQQAYDIPDDVVARIYN